MTRALVDCDGVLADFLTPCLEIINELMVDRVRFNANGVRVRHDSSGAEIMWDRPRTLDEMTNWNIFECLGVPSDVKSEVYRRMKKPGWCESVIQPLPGAQYGIQLLRDAGIEIFVVTSPMSGDTWHSERERWLKKHFDISHDHVIHAQTKYVVTGSCLIDDKPSHVVDWAKENGDYGILWDYVTNRHHVVEPDGPILRTSNWSFVKELLTRITF